MNSLQLEDLDRNELQDLLQNLVEDDRDGLLRSRVSQEVHTLRSVRGSRNTQGARTTTKKNRRPVSRDLWQRERIRPMSAPLKRSLSPSRPSRSPLSPARSQRSPARSPSAMLERLPAKVPRITAYKNGNDDVWVTVAASSMYQMLEHCTAKLGLVTPARRLFDHEGKEVLDLGTLWPDAKVYVSCGEPFRRPGELLPWTVKDARGRSVSPMKSSESQQRLVEGTDKTRILVRKNGDTSGDYASVVVRTRGSFDMDDEMDLCYAECTHKLGLHHPVSRLFDEEGNEVRSTRRLVKDQVIYASIGDDFRDPNTGDPLPWLPTSEFSNRRVTTEDESYFSRDRLVNTSMKVRVFAKKNGYEGDLEKATVIVNKEKPHGIYSLEEAMDLLLQECTDKLGMPRAKRLFHASGKAVRKPSELQKNETIYVSVGEPFRPLGEWGADWGIRRQEDLPEPKMKSARVVRLYARLNGDGTEHKVTVVAHPVARFTRQQAFGLLLDECTHQLGMTEGARRLFLLLQEHDDRLEVEEITPDNYEKIEKEMILYASSGQPFYDPIVMRTRMRERKGMPWTKKKQAQGKDAAPNPRRERLYNQNRKRRVRAFPNGHGEFMGSQSKGRLIVGKTMKDFLREATEVLGLPQAARRFYTMEGKRINDISEFQADQSVMVSMGEAFNSGKVELKDKF